MLNEPRDREGSDREVYRDAMVLVGFVVAVVALPAIYLALA
ncbi:hypothetical protein GCM10023208_21530 [Erythrobacter westpacificensis]|uniref:Uncharacterized protein n=1 Tax=Erythrobacter westpacificensis TaxID=1055231 RepID=A0ABP9KEG5_9SPHN